MFRGAERVARIMDCGARFAGRRKMGGGYAYYDLFQYRSFDIAGPNPTANERTRIYSEYKRFLDLQRRKAALAELQQPVAEEPRVPRNVNAHRPAPSKAVESAGVRDRRLAVVYLGEVGVHGQKRFCFERLQACSSNELALAAIVPARICVTLRPILRVSSEASCIGPSLPLVDAVRSYGFAPLSRHDDPALERVHLEGRLWSISPQAPPEPFHRVRARCGLVGFRYAAISCCDRLGSPHRGGSGRARACTCYSRPTTRHASFGGGKSAVS